MKTQELRIGNYYQEKGKIYKAEITDINNLYRCERNNLISNMEPVPLSELKEQSETFGDNGEFTLRLDHYDYPNIVTEVSLEQFREGRCSLPHIKYVHQYQNLYYDLTGKELEVEL
jgi:hypothetical protein